MDKPKTLADLVEALTSLSDLDPIERARRCPGLIDAAKAVLSAERHAAILAAVDPGRPGRVTQEKLAELLRVSRKTVTSAIQQGRAAQADQEA